MNTWKNIMAWVKFACEENGNPEFAQSIKVDFCGRFTRRIADADPVKKCIRLSKKHWPKLTEAQRRETVIHETCHIIVGPGVGHGALWQAAMHKAGLEPKVTMKLEYDQSCNRSKRVKANCGCGEIMMGPVRAKRLRLGIQTYTCRRCQQSVSL